jgi:protein O-GlcNAc transferase
MNHTTSDPDTQGNAAKLRSALALHQAGQLEQAAVLYRVILQSEPRHFEALQLLGTLAAQQSDPAAALKLFEAALLLNPDHADLLNNRGYVLRALHRPEEALASLDRALAMAPDFADALNNRGLVLTDLLRWEAALADFDRALTLVPNYAKALCNRGYVLSELQRFEEALASYDRALQLNPRYAEAYNNRGNTLRKLKRFEQALESYNLALCARADYAEALNNRGLALRELGRFEEALQSYDQALRINPDFAQVFVNRGNTLADLNRPDDALASYDRALAIKPDLAQAHVNRGNALRALNQVQAALDCYDRALAIAPDFVDALNNRGSALDGMERFDEALQSYQHAFRVNPQCTEALINCGNLLTDLKRPFEALQCFGHALKMEPDFDFLAGTWLHAKMKVCDWQGLQAHCDQLSAKVAQGSRVARPFYVTAFSDSPVVQRRAAQTWVQAKYPTATTLPELPRHQRTGKIRIGYFSADFHNHATAYLMAELFEKHDKNRFELFAFSFGPVTHDPMAVRLAAAFDRFIPVRHCTDKEVAILARSLHIDIALDLKGFTKESRTGIFALRVAPIQVNYLGYPGTMGADYMDYLIADKVVIPPSDQQHYREKIVYLPDSYQVNDARRQISDRVFTRQELGLPSDGFVYCCFNNNYKIMPDTFARWMRILQQVPGSVLWLLEDNAQAATNLRAEAARCNIDPARLVFAKRMDLPDHLARHRQADLFLDTSPYNAHTTASDALWAGLPVLSCPGRTFAGRVGASLLAAVGLPELIAPTPVAYEALAVALATAPERLAEIRAKLAGNRQTAPLFNAGRFARHLEAAFTTMLARHEMGLPPEAMEV